MHAPVHPVAWAQRRGQVVIWVGSQENRNAAFDDMSTDQTMQTNYVLEEVLIAQ